MIALKFFTVSTIQLLTNSPVLGPFMGAVGGTPEPFGAFEPMARKTFTEPSPKRTAEGGGGEIKIGPIRLQVVPGDITKERTDAIVNGTNPDLDMSQGTTCH